MPAGRRSRRRSTRWFAACRTNWRRRTAEVRLPRCADPDDQKFLELAQASAARWLVSKDNELLKLAPRCARDALFWIGLPQAWSLRKG